MAMQVDDGDAAGANERAARDKETPQEEAIRAWTECHAELIELMGQVEVINGTMHDLYDSCSQKSRAMVRRYCRFMSHYYERLELELSWDEQHLDSEDEHDPKTFWSGYEEDEELKNEGYGDGDDGEISGYSSNEPTRLTLEVRAGQKPLAKRSPIPYPDTYEATEDDFDISVLHLITNSFPKHPRITKHIKTRFLKESITNLSDVMELEEEELTRLFGESVMERHFKYLKKQI